MNDLVCEKTLTKEEFFEKNKEFLNKYTIPLDDGKKFISGILGNKNDIKKLDFPGVYAILENNKVIYIGSCFGRKIKIRFSEHSGGNFTHTSIIPYLKKTRNISEKEARDLFKTFEFLAFKCFSLEYLLISNTPGIINKSCNHK